MTDAESGAAVATQDAPLPTPITQEQPSGQRNGGKVHDHSAPPTYYNGGPPMPPPMKRPPMPPQPPPKVFFAPQKYGFFTANNVEQRWRDDPDKEKKSQADDIIANVTEKFFPGAKRAAEQGPPVPPFMPAPPGMPGIPPPPFIIPPAPHAAAAIPKDAKRIKFNDEDSDENELFAKLLYKKLKSIASRKRLEILHVSIMEMVRQAQEEDERERGVVNTQSTVPAPPAKVE